MGRITEPISNQWANSAGHWYSLDGEPCYEIIGKNGNRRNTTLADARRNNLVPSVTTVMRMMAAPGLEAWKLEQVLMAALTLPRQEGEADADYCARIRKDSQQQGKDAADAGTKIHGAVERYYRDGVAEVNDLAHVVGARDAIDALTGPQQWRAERSFANRLGYGGKCDLHSPEWVLDVKTKEFADPADCRLWDEHPMQLAAYRRGLDVPEARCGIVFVSRTVPGLACAREIPDDDLVRGLDMFDCLLRLWQIKTGHRPMLEAA